MPDGSNLSRDTGDKKDVWLRTYFLTRLAALDADRKSYWSTWQQESQMFAPKRGRFFASANDYTKGARKDQRLIDNTARLAARTFASGMQTGATSRSRPWLKLRFALGEGDATQAGQEWLDEVVKRILVVFQRSGLYDSLWALYHELGAFGTGVMLVDEDDDNVVIGYTLTVGEYWLASNKKLKVDTLYRSFWWTVRQIVDEFGRDNVPAGIAQLYDTGRLDLEYEVVHAIEPNPQALPADSRPNSQAGYAWDGRLNSQLPCRSVWFLRGLLGPGMDALLRVSGYHEFAAICPRWATTSTDTYGSDNPGEYSVGDTLGLQQQQRRKAEVIDKLSKPPMKGPPSMKNEPASMLPGGMTYVGENQGSGKYEPAFTVDPRAVEAVREDVMETQTRIKDAWYVQLFMSILQDERAQRATATEVVEARDEKMSMLGPMLERLHTEGLAPLVMRVFNIMARKGLIPPPPEDLPVAAMEVEFVSTLALAQKAADLTATERWIQFGISAREAFPEMIDNVDPDATYRDYGDKLGVQAKNMRDPEARDAYRQARAKQAADAAAPEQIKALAQAADAAGNIDVGGGQTAAGLALGSA